MKKLILCSTIFMGTLFVGTAANAHEQEEHYENNPNHAIIEESPVLSSNIDELVSQTSEKAKRMGYIWLCKKCNYVSSLHLIKLTASQRALEHAQKYGCNAQKHIVVKGV